MVMTAAYNAPRCAPCTTAMVEHARHSPRLSWLMRAGFFPRGAWHCPCDTGVLPRSYKPREGHARCRVQLKTRTCPCSARLLREPAVDRHQPCRGHLRGLCGAHLHHKDSRMGHSSFVDSPMPTRLDRPMIAPVVVEGPNPTHPFGGPGVGEVPVIPAMAALSNALDCAMGVRMRQPGMSPGRVLEAWWAHGGTKSTGRSSCQRGDSPNRPLLTGGSGSWVVARAARRGSRTPRRYAHACRARHASAGVPPCIIRSSSGEA
jgi:hypothetical protein